MDFLNGLILDQIFAEHTDSSSISRRLEEASQDTELTHHHIVDAVIITIAAWLTMVVVSIYLVSVVGVGSMSISNNITRSFIPIRSCKCRLLK
jgi:hypothetical protein